MRSKTFIKPVLLVALTMVTPLHADSPADDTAVAPPRDPNSQPEYRREKLSDAGLKPDPLIPSEQAVAFPDDF